MTYQMSKAYLDRLPILDFIPAIDFVCEIETVLTSKNIPVYRVKSWTGTVGVLTEDMLRSRIVSILEKFPGKLTFFGRSEDGKRYFYKVTKSDAKEILVDLKLTVSRAHFIIRDKFVKLARFLKLAKGQDKPIEKWSDVDDKLWKVLLYWLVVSVVIYVSFSQNILIVAIGSAMFTFVSVLLEPYTKSEYDW